MGGWIEQEQEDSGSPGNWRVSMAVAHGSKEALAEAIVALVGGIDSQVRSSLTTGTYKRQTSRHSSSSIKASSFNVEASCDVDVGHVTVREVGLREIGLREIGA